MIVKVYRRDGSVEEFEARLVEQDEWGYCRWEFELHFDLAVGDALALPRQEELFAVDRWEYAE